MQRKYLLIVTAVAEVGTGLVLLFLPSVLLGLLLGASAVAPEAIFVSRVAGAALLAIGVACWLARQDHGGPAQHGLLVGVLIYNIVVAVVIAYAGLVLRLVGLVLWLAVVLHSALAVWGVVCFWVKPRGEGATTRGVH